MASSNRIDVVVRLTPEDLAWARWLGLKRHDEAIAQGLQDKHGAKGKESRTLHCVGAAGEVAYARYSGLPAPTSVNTFKVPDFPGGVQVKTRRRWDYELLVRDNALDWHRYVLATFLEAPVVTLRGWMPASDARRPAWRKAHGGREPAFFPPTSALLPMAALLEVVRPVDRMTAPAEVWEAIQW